jgi:hypothetical protein
MSRPLGRIHCLSMLPELKGLLMPSMRLLSKSMEPKADVMELDQPTTRQRRRPEVISEHGSI